MARRNLNVFSMSFLDAITCGFGAVILFFMIINANMAERRDAILKDESAEVDRMELKVTTGRKNLVELKQDLAKLIEQWASLRGAKDQMVTEIHATQKQIETAKESSQARKETVAELRSDLDKLEAQTKQLQAASITPEEAGNRIRSFTGEGNRQYLTGLRMGGKRVVILVDASTSMLDRTLVNVLRRRHMSLEQQLEAPKWRQVVNTVDWLTTQIQPGTQFQVIAFTDHAWSLVDGSDGKWLTVSDGHELEQAVQTLRKTAPDGPTSLAAGFAAARALSPKPDDIFLLVDGLPTMGEVKPAREGVTGKERLDHFNRAVRELPVDVPVNVILFAMEGDPRSAPAYWWLALSTGGSMLAPAEDWP